MYERAYIHTYIHTYSRWHTILTSSSGDVRHLVGEAGLLHRGHRVASSDDGDAALAGQRGQRRSDGVRARGEGIELEHYTKKYETYFMRADPNRNSNCNILTIKHMLTDSAEIHEGMNSI